jgi:hypothetical protein
MNRLLALAALACLLAVGARAQQIEVATGWEGNDSFSHTYVIPSLAFDMGGGRALLVRAGFSYIQYSYPEGLGRTVVEAPGIVAGVGMRWSWPGLALSIMPGVDGRRVRRIPASGVVTSETVIGGLIDGSLFAFPTPITTLGLSAGYGTVNQYTYGRVLAMLLLTSPRPDEPLGFSVGAEVNAQGTREVQIIGGGGVAELALRAQRLALVARAGLTSTTFTDGTRTSEPYFGTGIRTTF